MSDDPEQQRRVILEAGSTAILRLDGPAGGRTLAIPVDQVADGLHWFLGSCAPLERGDPLRVESAVSGDARYVTRARVEASSPATFALRLEPLWSRVQERSFVRISAQGMTVRVVRTSRPDAPDDHGDVGSASARPSRSSDARSRPRRRARRKNGEGREPSPLPRASVAELLDVSAGGLRFKSTDAFETDEIVVCHFQLPGTSGFALPARIVRGQEGASGRPPRPGTGVEFIGLEEQDRARLLRWIYREQVRRHRLEARAAREREARPGR